MKRIIDAIRSNQSFLITSHVRLDGDAVGSELALYHLLRNMGKNAVVYNQDETPHNYRFLPGSEAILRTLDSIEPFDAVFVLDCSELDRIGDAATRIAEAKCIINVDHHISNKGEFGIGVVDPSASSVGELIFRLMEEMGADVTEDIAVNLYTAILTDTGSFRYSNTGKETFRIAGRLLEAGVSPHGVAAWVYDTNPIEKIKLMARVLGTLQFFCDGRISVLWVSKDMMRETGALPEHTENFVDLARSIEGVEVAAFFTEVEKDSYRVSLRSKGKIDVERVARMFGGGGHFSAAACRMEGSLAEVKNRMIRSISKG